MLAFQTINCKDHNITKCLEYVDDMFTIHIFGIINSDFKGSWMEQSWWFEVWLNPVGHFPKPLFSSQFQLCGDIRTMIVTRKTAKVYATLCHALLTKAFKEQNKKLIWWIVKCGRLDENYHHLPDNVGENL